MFTEAFVASERNAVYVPFPVAPEGLGEAVAGLRALGVAGFNVTVPHKQAILDLLDEAEPDARAIGAVNTVVRDGNRLVGFNTDAPGLVRALLEAHVKLHKERAVVLGAGGAARAAVVGLARAGVAQVAVIARDPGKAMRLVKEVEGSSRGTWLLSPKTNTEITSAFSQAAIVIQATSATMKEGIAREFVETIPWTAISDSAVAMDMVYQPLDTVFLQRARTRGLRTVDGLGMLLYQGALAYERWCNQPAPIEAMRKALGG